MYSPSNYKTLKGLLGAAEKVLSKSPLHKGKFAGCSRSMWLHNACYVAETKFNDVESIQNLRKKFAITRPQDLEGGHAVFGIPLPTRSYSIGDNIPGIGQIVDEVQTSHGKQFLIDSQWINECLIKSH